MTNFKHYRQERPLLACALLLMAVGAVQAGDGLVPANDGPDASHPNVRYDQRLKEQVPLDLAFVDENGEAITLAQCVNGKPTILILAWYQCPGLCNEVLVGMVDAARKLKLTCGTDFNIVTVSIDPKEKPGMALAKKRNFVTLYGRKEADWGWKFLTGQKENIDRLADAVGFRFEFDKMFQEYRHPSGIVILTPDGVISRYLSGIEYIDRGFDGHTVNDETKTLRLSLVEAGEGKTGDLTDRVFLSCFRFDVHKGKYSANVMLLMRGGGLLTLLILAGVYARTSWKVPGGRVLVVGLLAYVAMIPLIMYTALPVNSLPGWAQKSVILPIGIIVFLVGRWAWKSAKKSQRVEPLVGAGVE